MWLPCTFRMHNKDKQPTTILLGEKTSVLTCVFSWEGDPFQAAYAFPFFNFYIKKRFLRV
jgi:hypothetical protein